MLFFLEIKLHMQMQQLLSLILQKGYKIGKSTKKRVTGSRKPVLDKKKDVIRWPVLLLYPEVYEIDFIEDFCETDTFSSRLDIISFLFRFLFSIDIFRTCYLDWVSLAFLTCFQQSICRCHGIKKTSTLLTTPVKLLNCTIR